MATTGLGRKAAATALMAAAALDFRNHAQDKVYGSLKKFTTQSRVWVVEQISQL